MKWDDRISDPENPKRPRQIDVTIKRGDHLTLIECRIHHKRQDVKWIEELIGRRASLHADSVIGVSAAGFTVGAIRKAAKYQIALRDLRALTDAEVAAWGQSIGLTIIGYQYSDITITLWTDEYEALDAAAFREDGASERIVQLAFNQAGKYLTDNQMMTEEQRGRTAAFGMGIELLEPILAGGAYVRRVRIEGKVQPVALSVECPRVEAYGAPSTPKSDAVIERFALGETSIVHDGDNIAVVVDISTLELPSLCQFKGFKTSGTEREQNWESLELVGADKLRVRGHVAVALRFDNEAANSQP